MYHQFQIGKKTPIQFIQYPIDFSINGLYALAVCSKMSTSQNPIYPYRDRLEHVSLKQLVTGIAITSSPRWCFHFVATLV